MAHHRLVSLRQTAPWSSRFAPLPSAFLVVAVVIVPLIVLVVETVDDPWSVWSRPGITGAVWFSVWQGALSTVITLAVGLVPTWILARFPVRGRPILMAVFTAPFVLPTVVVGAAFLALLPTSLDRSLVAILLAHVFFNVSVVVRTVLPVWRSMDENLLAAARTLGADPLKVWRGVTWPLLRPAILSAASLVFVMCATSYGVIRVLGSGWSTVDVEIYRRAVALGDVSGAAVLAAVQALVVITALTMWSRRSSEWAVLSTTIPTRRRRPALEVLVWIIGLAFLVPIAALAATSLRSSTGWSLAGWRNLFGLTESRLPDTKIVEAVTNSAAYAVVAAGIAVPTGLSLARSAARRPRRWLTAIVDAPIGISAVAVGLGILITYDVDPIDVRASWWLVPVVHASVALPFVVRSAVPLIRSIPSGLGEAAATLGASPWRRWVHVELPLLRPAVTAASAFSLAMSLGEFGATSFLTRRDTTTLPILVESLLSRPGSLSVMTGSATAVLLLVVTGGLVVLVDRRTPT
ncbi:MAG: iron ABC transporter permease [Acidimicrobiia bacterium]|nr:iron ABC transporter permease [Acidimicrobiia bacterium]